MSECLESVSNSEIILGVFAGNEVMVRIKKPEAEIRLCGLSWTAPFEYSQIMFAAEAGS